ncbi:MAG: sugar ABC transporter substrate-binding protein [bacterium]
MNKSVIMVACLVLGVLTYLILLSVFTDSFTNELDSDKPVVTIMVSGSFEEMNLYKRLVGNFEKENPDIRVKLNFVPGDYTKKLRLLVSANVPPDVCIIYDREFREYIRWDCFVPLDSFINHPEPDLRADLSKYRPLAIKCFKSDGIQYGMPLYEGTLQIFYNRRLLREAGLAYPKSGWTYSEFLNDYLKILTRDTDNDGRVDQFGITPFSSWLYFTPMMINMGAEIINEDGSKWLMDTPEGWRAWDEYSQLMWKHKVLPDFSNRVEMGWGNIGFVVQRYAMWVSGPWNLGQLCDLPKLDFDVVMPPGEKYHKTRYITGSLVIFKQCKHKLAAWKLIKYITNTDKCQATLMGRIPVLQTVKDAYLRDDFSLIEDPELKEEVKKIVKYLKKFIVDEEKLYFLNFGDEYNEMDRHINHEEEALAWGRINGKKFVKRLINRYIESGIFNDQYKGQKVDKKIYED